MRTYHNQNNVSAFVHSWIWQSAAVHLIASPPHSNNNRINTNIYSHQSSKPENNTNVFLASKRAGWLAGGWMDGWMNTKMVNAGVCAHSRVLAHNTKPNEDNKITNFKSLNLIYTAQVDWKAAKRIMCGKCTYLIPNVWDLYECVAGGWSSESEDFILRIWCALCFHLCITHFFLNASRVQIFYHK